MPRHLSILLIAAALFLLTAMPVSAIDESKLVVSDVTYESGGTALKGIVAYMDDDPTSRPGILVIPEWWGVNDYMRYRAGALARQGYTVFVADMYGDGKQTDDPEVAGKWAGGVRGMPLMRERARAALEQFRAGGMVDPDKIGVIGFCFGGTGALELAYSGADVKGAVSFHGSLTVPQPGDTVKAAILVCHGAADTFESPESIAAFQKAMEERGVDWQMIYFGHALHSFTNPTSGKYGIPGVGHNEKAERRSFALMNSFFKDVFK